MNPEQQKPKTEAIEEKSEGLQKLDYVKANIDMPHVKPVSDIVENQFKKEGEEYNPEIMKDILYAFLAEGINKTGIFKSEKYNVTFPYAVFNTGDIAKVLYEKYGKETPSVVAQSETTTSVEKPKQRREFVFGSFQNTDMGNQFTFTEEVLHQLFKDIPGAIEKLKRGEVPNSDEICIVGSPTTKTGTMSEVFFNKMKNEAFSAYGEIYSEFVESTIPKNKEERENLNITLYGISMGASFATETAKRIISDGQVTQSLEESEKEGKSFLTVRLDTPPGPRNKPSLMSKIKTYGGFGVEAGETMLNMSDAYTRNVLLKNGQYMKQVNTVLTGRGIQENMSPDQKKMKEKTILQVFANLADGVPIPEGLKVTEVVGTGDLLTYSREFNKDVKKQQEEHPNTLGSNLSSDKESVRTFGANMRHGIPFMTRENEIKRMTQVVKSLQNL